MLTSTGRFSGTWDGGDVQGAGLCLMRERERERERERDSEGKGSL